ncbi:MAG: relaxase/mobilization nuclease domain-containing protein [Bacteroidia bacterium]|nr:relaxase/mobilization nuclease domain-containing protein [Bacteroidia bacterium]
MIIKVKSRKNKAFRQLLNYMIHSEERVPDSRIMLHNLSGNDIQTWVHEFEVNESYRQHRRKNSVILTHEILSWHPEDTPYLTLEGIEDMTREYIAKRNPNGLYMGVIHLSQDHYHVHLCVSGVEYKSGKAMRLSKQAFGELKQHTQDYQQEYYPELSKSVVAHGRATSPQLSDREYWYKLNTGQQTTKEKVFQRVQTVLEQSKSIADFEEKLKADGLDSYHRKGKFQGVVVDGRKYRLRRLGIQLDSFDKKKALEIETIR